MEWMDGSTDLYDTPLSTVYRKKLKNEEDEVAINYAYGNTLFLLIGDG